MDPKTFKAKAAGTVVRPSVGYHAFVPALLPPKLQFDAHFAVAISQADAVFSPIRT
jgi:hypothetical protein